MTRNLLYPRWFVLFSAILLTVGAAHAAINLDRTRIILNGAEQSVSLTATNDDQTRPFLAQAWIEDAQGNKSSDLLVAIPPVQRIELGASSLVKITSTRAVGRLPQDKETLFYFNLRGIPPRSENASVLQIALQIRIKLFYRPASISVRPGTVWQDKMTLRRTADGYDIANPTAYYITVTGLKERDGSDLDIAPLMIAPGGHASLKAPRLTAPVLTYINDYGGFPEVVFHCQEDICRAGTQ